MVSEIEGSTVPSRTEWTHRVFRKGAKPVRLISTDKNWDKHQNLKTQ